MGILLSRFRRKGSPLEVLEKLDSEIREIEENKSNAQTKQKKIAKILYLYSLGMCLVCCITFYYQYSSLLKDNLLYLVPLALSPVVLLLINKIISWYYVKLIKKSQSKLIEMKKEKKRILDEVMDKETYKVAKEILDKYSTDTPKQSQELRKRIVPASSSSNGQSLQLQVGKSPPYQPLHQNKSPMLMTPTGSKSPMTSRVQPVQGAPGPRLRLPAPILPLQRSYMDKLVEYLIGDGPNNRFALICSRCHSHNGMALKEEFEYISFKCCYCFFYNPARKIRPEAPKLEDLTFSQTESNDSASDSDSKAPMVDDVKANSERENHTSTVEKNKNSEAINLGSTNPFEEGNNDSEKENDSINEPDTGESKPLNEPPQKETIANVN